MAIYRIKITMPDGSKGRYTGLFADGFEAIALLAVSGLIGFAAGVLQAKGWPL